MGKTMKENKQLSPPPSENFSRRKMIGKILASTAALGAASSFAKGSDLTPTPPVSPPQPSKLDEALIQGMAPGVILDHATTSWAKVRNDVSRTRGELHDNFAALQQLVEDKKYLTIDTPISISDSIKLTVKNQLIEGRSNCLITPLEGMQSKYLFEIHADATRLHGLVMDNPKLLKTARGGRQGGVMIAANFCEISNSYFYRMLQSVVAQASFGAYGTKIIDNWFLECLGAGPGMSDLKSNLGEDRGDAVSIWGSGTILTGNHAYLKEGEDARIAFHAEGLPHTPKVKRDFDHKDIIFMNNMAQGAFRRHFAFENITNGVSMGNVSMGGATWWGESYTQCKNIIVENTIRFTTGPDNKNGQAWRPVKAGTAVLNYNEGVKISSNIWLAPGARASGFAIASQIGDHDITLSGNMINDGSKENIAVYLNKPKSVRIQNLHTQGFGRAISLVAREETTLFSSNCIHECAGTDTGVQIIHGSGGSIQIDGDFYSGVTDGFKVANLQQLTISNTTVEAQNTFAALNNIKQNLLITNNVGRGGKKLPLHYAGTTAPEVSWNVEGNLGISSQLAYTEAQVNSADSMLNQRSKYAGKNIVLSNQRILVALGDAPDAPWFSLTDQKTFKPA